MSNYSSSYQTAFSIKGIFPLSAKRPPGLNLFFGIFLALATSLLPAQTPRLVVPVGHTDIVSSVAFSPDGETILTGSYDQTAKLWDLDGNELMTFAGHTSLITSVAFAPDGKSVLAGNFIGIAKRWDLAGKELTSFSGLDFPIVSISFSPNGKFVATQDFGQTAVLWNLAGDRLKAFHINTIEGEAIAFSPDNKSLLTSGNDLDHAAKLWDLETLQLKKTFSGHTGKVLSVAFSPDGKKLLTGSDDHSVILWDSSGAKLDMFPGHENQIHSVRFSPDGENILIGIKDGTAKLLSLSGDRLMTFSTQTGKVLSMAFSPNSKTVLIGRKDGSAERWDLNKKKSKPFLGKSSAVSSMTFSPDGRTVLTGRQQGTADLWDLAGKPLATFTGYNNFVHHVAFYPDGKTALTGRVDGKAELWDLSGREFISTSGHHSNVLSVAFSIDGKASLTSSADSTDRHWDLAHTELELSGAEATWNISTFYSPDGKSVLSINGGKTAILQDRKTDSLLCSFSGHDGILAGAFSPDGNSILTSGMDSTAKLWDLDGNVLKTFSGHTSFVYSVAYSPDGKTVLTGSADNTAKLWDLDGNKLKTLIGHSSGISSAVFSPDGKTILTGSADNTAKLWDRKSGKELATLIMLDSANWVIASPSGLFDASPGAMRFLYYTLGLEVIELEQLKERYYEPGLLAKVMGFSTEPLREVGGFSSIALYPNVTLQLDTLNNQLGIQLSPRNGGLGKISIYINGKEVVEDANPPRGFEKIRSTALTIELDKYTRYFLLDSLNEVSIRAYNQAGWLKSAPYSIRYRPLFARSKGSNNSTGSTLRRRKRKPELHALVVGTADYAGTNLDLKYSGKDARDMANALRQVGTQLFGTSRVSVHLLTTDTTELSQHPTKTNIEKAFGQIKNQARAEDILVVYFSGHGVSYGDADRALFYYLTKDIASENLSDAGVRARRTVSSAELTRWINDIPALKQVLILDACNSGRIIENLTSGQKELNSSQIRALDRMKDRTGMFVLTGSAADKVSFEAGQFGQGLLTYSLLQGMSGLALTPDKRVDVSTLFEYARDQVPELAKGIGGVQTPMLVGPQGGSFDIGVVNGKVNIPLAQEKSVFIRNYFQDETFGDALQLSKALESYFRDLTVKGAQAEIIYVDVNEYENAYSIRGRYTLEKEAVQLRGRLFRGNTPVGEEFRLSGHANAVPELVEAIVETVSEML